MLLQPVQCLTEDNLDTKLVKCFFSSYFNNYSTSSFQDSNNFRCGDTKFRAIKCSTMNNEFGKRMEPNQKVFWLKMTSYEDGNETIAYAMSKLNDEIL